MPSNQNVGNIYMDLLLNQSIFNKQMSTLQKTTSNLMAKVAKVAGIAFLGKKIYDFASAWMELGSDLEEVQNVVDVTFTTMSDRVNKFSKTTQQLVGINETTTKTFMGQFGSMSKAFGFSEEQAYNMSEALIKMGGDAASFKNASLDVAFTKLKSVFTGETEALKDWGIVMSQTSLDQHALAKGINKSTSEMSEQEKVALRLNFIMKQLKDAQGDYTRTFDGYANSMKNIQQTFEAAKTNIGRGLINLTAWFRTLLLQVAQTFEKISQKFLEFTRRFTNGKDVEGIKTGTSNIVNEIANIGTEAEDTQKKVQRFVAGFDKLNKVSTGSDDSSKTKSTDDNLINSLLTEALDYNMEEIKKKTEETNSLLDKMAGKYPKLTKSMTNLWDSLKGLAGISWDYIKIFWNSFLKPLGQYAAENILPPFLDVISGIIKVITEMLKANKPLFQDILDNFLKPLAEVLGNLLKKALEWTAEQLEKLAEWIKNNPEKFQSLTKVLISLAAALATFTTALTVCLAIAGVVAIVKNAGGVLAIVGTALSGVGAAISGIGGPILAIAAIIGVLVGAVVWCALNWDLVKEKATGAINRIKETAGIMKDTFAEFPTIFKGFGEGILANITAPFVGIKEFIDTLFNEIKKMSKDGTLSIVGVISAIFKATLNGVIAFIETTINASIKGLNGIMKAVSNASGSNIGTIQMVNLPRFGNGGYVKGQGSRGILAEVGDVKTGTGEWITRDDQMEAIISKSAIETAKAIALINKTEKTSGGDTEVNVYLDSEKIGANIIKRNKNTRQQTGLALF